MLAGTRLGTMAWPVPLVLPWTAIFLMAVLEPVLLTVAAWRAPRRVASTSPLCVQKKTAPDVMEKRSRKYTEAATANSNRVAPLSPSFALPCPLITPNVLVRANRPSLHVAHRGRGAQIDFEREARVAEHRPQINERPVVAARDGDRHLLGASRPGARHGHVVGSQVGDAVAAGCRAGAEDG